MTIQQANHHRYVVEIVRRVLREWYEARENYTANPKGVEGHNEAFRRLSNATGALQALAAGMPPFPLTAEVAEDLEGYEAGEPKFIDRFAPPCLFLDGTVRNGEELVAIQEPKPGGQIVGAGEIATEIRAFHMPPIAWEKP